MIAITVLLCVRGGRATGHRWWGVRLGLSSVAVAAAWAATLLMGDPIYGTPIRQVGIAGICAIAIAAASTARLGFVVPPVILGVGLLLGVHYHRLIATRDYTGTTAIASLTRDWAEVSLREVNLRLASTPLQHPGVLTDEAIIRLGLDPGALRRDLRVARVHRRWFTPITGIYHVQWSDPLVNVVIDASTGVATATGEVEGISKLMETH